MTYDVDALRAREFPWTLRGEHIYLDNAKTGALPARAVATAAEWAALRAEPYRLSTYQDLEVFGKSRELVAKLIGAKAGEIACMQNTTYGINIASLCLPLESGDVVLTYDGEYPADVYPWMSLARKGVKLELLPKRDGLQDEARLLEELKRPEVKVVTMSWVSFSTGYRADLATIGRACRERGIYFVVDAIQGVGAMQLDVSKLDIDILACGGQKWLLAPWGTGFVYVREELARTLDPAVVGWLAMRSSEDFTRMVDYDFTFYDDARRFQINTLPAQDFAGMNASIEMCLELGAEAVEKHIEGIVTEAVTWAGANGDKVRLVTPADPKKRAGVLAIAPRDPKVASKALSGARISHSLREGAIRFSPHCYNTSAEMRKALDVLEGVTTGSQTR
ncbi:MAG: aminotransferase class V-fold PLP-dependent enzyme [Gemmatimonadaceae bacterium]|nr:aminotransferase class V-fold PLP-dependent enzyme [Gemmatimonadaceae bacterium]